MKLKLEIDYQTAIAERTHYVKAKTKQLRKFGYANLKESEVDAQVTAILEGKTLENGLTVIGGFMKDEIKGEAK